MKTTDLTKQALKSIVNNAIGGIQSIQPDNTYGCDLHNELFNMGYFVTYHFQAKQWLKDCKIDPFEAVDEVVQYEKDNFGEVNTEMTAKTIVNMYAYIAGECILAESKTLSDNWDNLLSAKDLKKITSELRKLLK